MKRLCAMGSLYLAIAYPAHGDTDWPIEPVDEDHPIANTMGEFVQGDEGPYQHEGIDILGVPFDEAGAQFVVVTVRGNIVQVLMNPNSRDNYIMIQDEGSKRIYRYAHLEYSTVPISTVLRANNSSSTPASIDERMNDPESWVDLEKGDKLALLSNLFPCGFNHVHYEIQRINPDNTKTPLNPLRTVRPDPDDDDPKVVNIFLAKHGEPGWSEIALNADTDANACTTVSGQVDIVVEVSDRDDASSSLLGVANVGLHRLRWQACKSIFCRWKDTHIFDEMPAKWTIQGNDATADHFSVDDPWRSTSSYCEGESGNRTFMVASSFVDGGSWNTADGDYSNGKYTLRVEARDFGKNKGKKEIKVCVQN